MAEQVQVSCIKKSNRTNPHERIYSIGGMHGGKRWELTETDAIAGIQQGKWTFYVSVGGRTVEVHIQHTPTGHLFLKTVADNYAPNNLLSLPECP